MSLKKLPSNKTRRTDSKQAQVLAILHSKQGATIATIMEATGWQPHSVRGFLTAVVRKKLRLTLVSEKTSDEWREATYASLFSIARAITGTAWNGPRFFGLRIDKGAAVSPDAAGAPLGPLDGRHLARNSGIRPQQAAVAQRPNDKSAAVMSPLHGGERRS